jgi:flagellar basal body P-ring protein FlgI
MRIARPAHFIIAAATLALASYSVLHAADKKAKKDDEEKSKEPRLIGDITSVEGLQPFVLEGVGLVSRLEGTGSDPLPGPDRAALQLDMQKRGIRGVDDILRSPQTALVRIRATIPPGTRSCKTAGCWCKLEQKTKRWKEMEGPPRRHKGDTFDVEVEIPARDSATSLEGGWLLEAWLYEVAPVQGGGALGGHVWARAEGPVMVTAGIGTENKSPADLRRGRVLGGAIASRDFDIALIIDSEHTARWTAQIGNRINDRFQHKTRDGKPIADAKNGQRITLRIPPQYRQNIARFLAVLRYMPIYVSESGEAERLERLQNELLNPKTTPIAAIKLEGLGARSAETLKGALTNASPDVRFFGAEALAYLGEPAAAEPLAAAARELSEYRAHALTALSSLNEAISRIKLRELMSDSDSVELRYGAFRALRVLDPDDPAVTGEVIDDYLHLHRVITRGKPLIHISSRERAEIVLFGPEQQLQTPLLLKAGNSIILTASKQSSQVQVSRFAKGQPTNHQLCELGIDDVIRRVVRLGGTYPDVVNLLVNADKNHNLPGRLDFDVLPDPTRMAARLRKIADGNEPPSETVAMPNLFHWRESKRSTAGSDNESEVAETDDAESSKPEKSLSKKTSLRDRLFRRSAN